MKIAGIIFFASSIYFGATRVGNGSHGFHGVEKGREGILMNYFISAILVPAVTLATIIRVHRRLDETCEKNEKIFRSETGILEPKTIHGQSIKIHFSDIHSKAAVLYKMQEDRVIQDSIDYNDGFFAEYKSPEAIREKMLELYTPARSFAVGIISEKSAQATWLSLMGSLRHIGPEDVKRFAAQSLILAVGLGVVIGTYEMLAKDNQHDRITYSITWTFFSQSSSIMGF